MDYETLLHKLKDLDMELPIGEKLPPTIRTEKGFLDKHTLGFIIYLFNVLRPMYLVKYAEDLIKNPLQPRDTMINESIIITSITGLESFITSTFKALSSKIKVEELSPKILFEFCEKINCVDKFKKKVKHYDGYSFFLNEILPKKLTLQQKQRCEIAYKLFGIKLPEDLGEEKSKLWDAIFREGGYMDIRHISIHKGILRPHVSGYPKKLTFDYTTNVVYNISDVVYSLDKILIKKFPKDDYPFLYVPIEIFKN